MVSIRRAACVCVCVPPPDVSQHRTYKQVYILSNSFSGRFASERTTGCGVSDGTRAVLATNYGIYLSPRHPTLPLLQARFRVDGPRAVTSRPLPVLAVPVVHRWTDEQRKSSYVVFSNFRLFRSPTRTTLTLYLYVSRPTLRLFRYAPERRIQAAVEWNLDEFQSATRKFYKR